MKDTWREKLTLTSHVKARVKMVKAQDSIMDKNLKPVLHQYKLGNKQQF